MACTWDSAPGTLHLGPHLGPHTWDHIGDPAPGNPHSGKSSEAPQLQGWLLAKAETRESIENNAYKVEAFH